MNQSYMKVQTLVHLFHQISINKSLGCTSYATCNFVQTLKFEWNTYFPLRFLGILFKLFINQSHMKVYALIHSFDQIRVNGSLGCTSYVTYNFM